MAEKKVEENIEALQAQQEKAEEKKVESKPAVEKESKKEEKEVIELEREYTIPLRKGILKAPRYRRAKKAVRLVKEFLAKHMRVENRDLRLVKIDMYLNQELWFRGIKKPATKITVKAIKKNGIVYAELAQLPEVHRYAKERLEKRKIADIKKVAPTKKEAKTEEQKTDEKEKEKATQEAGIKEQKKEAKTKKHSTDSTHEKKTHPKRQSLKK